MTHFNLVKKNIRGNLKNYLLYFLSMIFSIMIYYTFVSLQYSTEVQSGIESSMSLSNVFLVASVILILFVGVFVLYSNSFFIRRRKKEVGLYSLLGLQKKTIGKLLLYENLLLGVFALVIGIVLGALFSKLFTMVLLRLMDAPVDISFSLSIEAIINTTIVFALLILFTSIQAYRLIYRFQLIELFQAEKKGEQAPRASMIAAGLGLLLLSCGYWLASRPITTTEEFSIKLGMILIGIVVGTYLLFRSLTPYLLKLSQKNKSYYYRGVNLISVSHLLYRLKANTSALTIVALLNAIALIAISIGYSMYYSNQQNTSIEAPFSYMYVSKNKSFDDQVQKVISMDTKHSLRSKLDIPVIEVKGDISNPEMESYLEGSPIKLISESTYNRVSISLNRKTSIQLSGNQVAGIQPYLTDYSSSDYQGHTSTLQLPHGYQKLTFQTMVKDRILNWSYPDFSLVVSDTLFIQIAKQIPPLTYKAYKVNSEETSKETSDQLTQLAEAKGLQMMTFYSVYRGGVESGGLNMFILGFLGLVFLAAIGSIIYFKQLTEADVDKKRYEILRKIGLGKKYIQTAIRKQIFFIFSLPLIIGILHSFMILQVLSGIKLITGNLIVPIVLSMTAYVVIYLGYYLLTLKSIQKVVNN